MSERADSTAGGSTEPAPPGSAAPLEEVLAWLGEDLDEGVERLAAARGVPASELIRELVAGARNSAPSLVRRSERRWGAFDCVVAATLALLLALVGWAGWSLAHPREPRALTVLERLFGGSSTPVGDAELTGRTVLALPIEPAGYALLGNLPTRLSAAVVPAPPTDGAVARPVLRLDDLVVLRAESADHGVAVVVAVPEALVPALLEALPGATVHLLRPPPPAPPPQGTP